MKLIKKIDPELNNRLNDDDGGNKNQHKVKNKLPDSMIGLKAMREPEREWKRRERVAHPLSSPRERKSIRGAVESSSHGSCASRTTLSWCTWLSFMCSTSSLSSYTPLMTALLIVWLDFFRAARSTFFSTGVQLVERVDDSCHSRTHWAVVLHIRATRPGSAVSALQIPEPNFKVPFIGRWRYYNLSISHLTQSCQQSASLLFFPFGLRNQIIWHEQQVPHVWKLPLAFIDGKTHLLLIIKSLRETNLDDACGDGERGVKCAWVWWS